MPVVLAALAAGAFAVAVTAALLFLPNKSGAPGRAASARDTTAAADTGVDVRLRSSRMEAGDCIGTFEVTRGAGTRADFVAFVMDKSGAVIARDTQTVKAAVRGLLVDFRFRRTGCDRIDDWQMQVTTPKASPK